MFMVKLAKKIINPLGVDIMGYPHRLVQNRIRLMNLHDISVVFDIGASTGQYVNEIRKAGYQGKIVSFEPLKRAFLSLKKSSEKDDKWQILNMAVGNTIGELEINVSANLVSSSFRNISNLCLDNAPGTRYVNKEKVKMITLDSVIDKHKLHDDSLFVKIDVQGFEKEVIEGALNSIDKITGFQLELSLFQVYEGSLLFKEMLDLLNQYGFSLMSLEPGFSDRKTGKLLEADGIFFRN